MENLIVLDEDIALNDDDNIFKLGYVNSLFAMKLLNFIEREFNIVVDNEEMDLENFSSINSIEKLIAKKVN